MPQFKGNDSGNLVIFSCFTFLGQVLECGLCAYLLTIHPHLCRYLEISFGVNPERRVANTIGAMVKL